MVTVCESMCVCLSVFCVPVWGLELECIGLQHFIIKVHLKNIDSGVLHFVHLSTCSSFLYLIISFLSQHINKLFKKHLFFKFLIYM